VYQLLGGDLVAADFLFLGGPPGLVPPNKHFPRWRAGASQRLGAYPRRRRRPVTAISEGASANSRIYRGKHQAR